MKTTAGWGSTSAAILDIVQAFGPMTRQEIGNHLEMDRMYVSAIITRMTKDTPKAGKRLYVERYVYDSEGQKRYPRAVYAAGNKPCAKRPKADHKENRRRYLAGLRKRMTGNSVFNLGLTRRQYEAKRRAG